MTPAHDDTSDQSSEELDHLLKAALGGLTPHQALMQATRSENQNPEKKAAAIAKNRQRALELLAVLEKNHGGHTAG